MIHLHLLVFGKLRHQGFSAIEQDFIKRFGNAKFSVTELKSQSPEKDRDLWLQKIKSLQKDRPSKVVLCEEKGREFTSLKFSEFIFSGSSQSFIFSIGPAEGHHDDIKKGPYEKITLSPFTLPHQLARILLVEQFYRAESIFKGHPYHNE